MPLLTKTTRRSCVSRRPGLLTPKQTTVTAGGAAIIVRPISWGARRRLRRPAVSRSTLHPRGVRHSRH